MLSFYDFLEEGWSWSICFVSCLHLKTTSTMNLLFIRFHEIESQINYRCAKNFKTIFQSFWGRQNHNIVSFSPWSHSRLPIQL